MAEADALYSRGALVTPRANNAASAYLKVLSIAPDNADAKAKLSESSSA
jgi:hypothetical protein